MDKKTMMIAGGAFIAGGLVMAVVSGVGEHDGWERIQGNDSGEMARSMHNMMHDDEDVQTNNANKSVGGDTTQGGMMGNDDMGMGSMHDMNMMVASEREFLQEMIPHHEEAVATAKEVLARGGSTPEIKTLAQNIITAQETEIASMKSWYKAWYGVDYVASGKYVSMMRPLTNLSGAALDKVFLADMIMHHKGAVMMASSVMPHIEHSEMTTLVGNIKTTQTAEITQMQNLLKTL